VNECEKEMAGAKALVNSRLRAKRRKQGAPLPVASCPKPQKSCGNLQPCKGSKLEQLFATGRVQNVAIKHPNFIAMSLKRITPDEGLVLMTGVALVLVGCVGYVIWHVVRLVY
jgi:hypothetical protein